MSDPAPIWTVADAKARLSEEELAMAFDDPKLPRASLRGEYLYIDGENEPYFRDPEYCIFLEVKDLKISGGFEAEDFGKGDSSMQLAAMTLRGSAKLEGRKDQFAVAGAKTDHSPPIKFHLKHVPDNETKFHWRVTIGFQMYDCELDKEEGFWISGYCAKQPFDAIIAAVRTGRVEKLRVGMKTMMWTKKKSTGFMLGMPMTFHLAPPVDKESTTPALEQGTITDLTWDERYGLGAPKTVNDYTPPKPVVVELPARFYFMLITLIGISAIIAVILFLRY